VRPLLRQVEFPFVGLFEGNAHLVDQELADDLRPVDRERFHRLFTREPGAGVDDVLDQLRRRVVRPLVDDPALRRERVAVGRVGGLGHEQHLHACLCEHAGPRQYGDAGADD